MKKYYELEVIGNLQKRTGNPIPYTRVLRHAWREDAQRYMDWQQYVRSTFMIQNPGTHNIVGKKWGPPIKVENSKVMIEAVVRVTFSSESHGDLDNIVKGMLDSLLDNDKHVMRIDASAAHGEIGRVWIAITLDDTAVI